MANHQNKPTAIEARILAAVSGLQGKKIINGKPMHGVHSVYSGLWANVVKATGSKEAAVATFDAMVESGKLYRKPSKGGYSYATSPFPASERKTDSDGYFA